MRKAPHTPETIGLLNGSTIVDHVTLVAPCGGGLLYRGIDGAEWIVRQSSLECIGGEWYATGYTRAE